MPSLDVVMNLYAIMRTILYARVRTVYYNHGTLMWTPYVRRHNYTHIHHNIIQYICIVTTFKLQGTKAICIITEAHLPGPRVIAPPRFALFRTKIF